MNVANDFLTDFLDHCNENGREIRAYFLKKYLEWRNISPKELAENGKKEEAYFPRFITTNELSIKEHTRKSAISTIKKFLIFHGADLQMHRKRKQKLHYIDDPAMQDFMRLCGNKQSTKRVVNVHLGSYCDFRDMTPTELVEEAKQVTKHDLRRKIALFYETLTIKSKGTRTKYVLKFYKYLTNTYIEIPNVSNDTNKKLGITGTIVDKDLVRQMLQVADLRDSMVVLACFESGMNPSDLVALNYGDLKDYLNLEEPDTITHCTVIVHERKKTGYEFLACFGYQTLRYMSKWLQRRKKGIIGFTEDLTDSTPIFTSKKATTQRLTPQSISMILRRLSKRAGLKEDYTTSDFRNSFNTRSKKMLKHYDKELFMGHYGGIERHYDVSDIHYYIEEYSKAYELLFDLSYDNEKVQTLAEENREIKKAMKNITQVLEGIYQKLYDKQGSKVITKEDLEEALLEAKKIQ